MGFYTKKLSPIQGCVLCPLRPKSSQEPRSTAMFIQVSNWFSFPKNWATDWYVFFSKSAMKCVIFWMQLALRPWFEPTLLGGRSVLFGTLPSGDLPLSPRGISPAPPHTTRATRHQLGLGPTGKSLKSWRSGPGRSDVGTWSWDQREFLKISSRKM